LGETGSLLKAHPIGQYAPGGVGTVDKIIEVISVSQVEHFEDQDGRQRKNKHDDVNGKCLIDQLAAKGRVIEAQAEPEGRFFFAEVKALYGDKHHQWDKEQREPDKFIIAKYQHNQAYTGNGNMERGI